MTDNGTPPRGFPANDPYMPGEARQVARTPAKLDLSKLPEGYGIRFEVRISDSTGNESKPIWIGWSLRLIDGVGKPAKVLKVGNDATLLAWQNTVGC